MKKFWGLCLALLMCLMLTACGGSKGETLASDIIVHVEINPSFDIHVNADGMIESVECLNEDAQTVYAEMDLSGVVYEEGFMQLLTAIHEAGFLKESAQITVEIKQKANVTYEISKVTDEVLEDFNTNVVAIESDVSDEVVEEQESGVFVDSSTSPISVWSFEDSQEVMSGVMLYLDANNIIVLVTGHTTGSEEFGKSLGLEGLDLYEGLSKLLDAMRQNGYLDENKSLLIHADREDRQIKLYQFIAQYERENDIDFLYPEVYYANEWEVTNGDRITVDKLDDGWYKRTETYQNGVLRKVFIESESGEHFLHSEEQYDENGVITSYICEELDVYHEYEYDANGMPLYQVITSKDGQTKQEQFFENGVLVKQIVTSTDYIGTTWYDADGNIIESTDEYLDAE